MRGRYGKSLGLAAHGLTADSLRDSDSREKEWGGYLTASSGFKVHIYVCICIYMHIYLHTCTYNSLPLSLLSLFHTYMTCAHTHIPQNLVSDGRANDNQEIDYNNIVILTLIYLEQEFGWKQ